MASNKPNAKVGTYHPDKRTIGQLLSTTSPPIVVPDWQRSFSWTKSHVETFWNDLSEFARRNSGAKIENEYFLGSIVIVEASDNSSLLLDGQQRLATSAILLSVIRDFLGRYDKNAAKSLQSKYLTDHDLYYICSSIFIFIL